MMRRFEFVDGKSSKFWAISMDGCDVLTAWGRIGTNGQSKTKTLTDTATAEKEYNKLIKQKTSKGYVEVGEEEEPAPAAAAEPAPATAAEPAPAAAAEPAEPSGDERVVWGDSPPDFVPSRGGYPRPYEVDGDEVWATILEKLYDSRHLTGIAAGRSKASKLGASLADKLIASVDEGSAVDIEAGAALLLMCTYWGYDNSEVIARWMIAKHGLAFTTEAALFASNLGRNGGGDSYYLFDQAHPATALRQWEVDRLPDENANSLISGFLELRRADASAAENEHNAAADAVRRAWPSLNYAGRALAAIAFPTEGFWRDVELPAGDWDEGYYTKYACWLVATPDEPAAAAAFAARVPARCFEDKHAFAAVDRLGCGAAAAFDKLGDRGCVTWTPALEHVESRAVFALYPKLGAHALPYVHVLDRRFAVATQALAPVAADKRSHYHGSARVLLARLGDGHGAEMLRLAGELPDAAAAAVRETEGGPGGPVATAAELPGFLVSPPWKRKVKAAKPIVLALDPLPFEPKSHMTDGEKTAARISRFHRKESPAVVANELRATLAKGGWYSRNIWNLAGISDWATARELLDENNDAGWHFDRWYGEAAGPVMAANWGDSAGEFFVRFGASDKVTTCEAMAAIEDSRLAPLIAETFSRLKTGRAAAQQWLLRFPHAAAVGLVPNAVTKAKKPREFAENALRLIAANGHEHTVREVAAQYGDDAAKAVSHLLETDPYDQIPSRMPKVPGWWSANAFPRLVVASSGNVLGNEAMDAAQMALALSNLDSSYPGLGALQELCTPESLEDFAIAVFKTWLLFGASSKEYWALYTMGWFGRDEAARVLAPLIRKWPGESAAKRATTGLDVMALIGTDVAMMHIYGISQKVKFKSIKKRAGEVVDELANELGLSRDELGDRLVPDFDLRAGGTTTIDYGPRSFTIRFDEALKPVVFDEAGKQLKSLPGPGKKDGDGSAAEQKRFRALNKDVKTVARQQVERLERAMCTQRRWSLQDFRQFFVEHPLVVNLTRRLVWGAYEDGKLSSTFRVDEDGGSVDRDDEPVSLSDETIGIPHTLDLPDVKAWGEVFADYEIMQPFGQISRDVHQPSDGTIDRILGVSVPAPKLVYGLERYGWRRGEVIDGGAFYSHEKELGDVLAYVAYEGAVGMGYIEEEEPLKLTELRFSTDGKKLGLDEVDPVTFSETVSDLLKVLPA